MNSFIDRLSNLINEYLYITPGYSTKFFVSILIFLSGVVLSFIIRRTIKTHVKDNSKRYIATKTFTYAIRIIVFIVFFNIWIGMGGELLAYFGLLSAGIAIALQEAIANFAGWVFIMFGKPFSVGDRIEIDGKMGDVIDIRTSQTSLLEIGNWVSADQSTGRVIHIPNGWFLKKPLANFTQRFNFIWNEIEVTITFESDWKKAKTILSTILNDNMYLTKEDAEKHVHEASADYLIYFKNLTPIVWTRVEKNGITLCMRYLVKPKQRRSSTHKIWEAVLVAFCGENKINFAYPTQRILLDESSNNPPKNS
jgi:small-conductance mechanosensitive channel